LSFEPTAQPQIVKLRRGHAVELFECGSEPLDLFLRRHALPSQTSGGAQTYVAEIGDTVAGYFSLTVGQVEYADATERLAKGLARRPVPVMILARLAVARDRQGRGLGAAQLRDALRRTAQAADIAGIRALVVHAKNEQAKRFYQHFDFDIAANEPFHLFLLMKQIHRLMKS
jgi:GNAT superfamily N-acetyltransferase